MSEQEENGLTLEGLAQRLETLERAQAGAEPAGKFIGPASMGEQEGYGQTVQRPDQRLEAYLPGEPAYEVAGAGDETPTFVPELTTRLALLEGEHAQLRRRVATLEVGTPQPSEPRGISTDTLTADRVAAGELDVTQEGGAQAATIWTDSDTAATLLSTSLHSKPALRGECTQTGHGVEGTSQLGRGVHGRGVIGVSGESSRTGEAGVYASRGPIFPTEGPGVVGDGMGAAYAGVLGRGSTGVWGQSGQEGFSGVYGQHTGRSGYGIVGDGTGNGAGVLGRGSSVGVTGESTSPGHTGVRGTNNSGFGVVGNGGGEYPGVFGIGSTEDPKGLGVVGTSLKGCGGRFDGGRAPLWLLPKESPGRPTSGDHKKGELYLDSEGTLFVCTADGTPGTWRRFTTAAA